MLDNPKHEAFAQALAVGETSIGAYRAVFHGNERTGKKTAWKIKRRPEVKARVLELREEAREGAFSVAERRSVLARLVRHGAEDSAAYIANKIRALEIDARFAGELQPLPGKKEPASSLEKAFHDLIFGRPAKAAGTSKPAKSSAARSARS